MAGNRIKGLTIEIGGDTTKLSDSLKGVDKSLKDTQSQLKDVNKLLKLDPTNVDLLRQKHDLLSKAVKDTKEREKELQKALEQLKEAGDTEENRHQQDLLQRELVETQQSLKDLRHWSHLQPVRRMYKRRLQRSLQLQGSPLRACSAWLRRLRHQLMICSL